MITTHLRRAAQKLPFWLLDQRRTRGFSLLHDLRYWTRQNPVTTIVDVGANIGETVVAFKRFFPGSAVYAAEPVAETFRQLEQHCRDLSGVTCLNMGFGDVAGTASIHVAQDNKFSSLLHTSSAANRCHRTEPVAMDTLDSFCDRLSIDAVDILKTDTEGFDLKVLQGAVGLLRQKRIRFIATEATTLSGTRNNTSFEDIAAYLRPYDLFPAGFYDIVYTDGDCGPIRVMNVLFSQL